MTKRKFYRTVITVTVLSEEPLPDVVDFEDVEYQMTHGDYSGDTKVTSREELNGLEVANELHRQGSDPAFFRLAENGDDEDEQEDEDSDEPPTCILTGTPGEDPDDCTTHEHEK